MVGDGLYIGRIWYTYPIKPNTLRSYDNVLGFINSSLGTGEAPSDGPPAK
ncbi:MAG: hypothetical protein IH962_04700 [Chloroflexi bacterium]|nr:hypothetical protein [Chloroflexota bacterium]